MDMEEPDGIAGGSSTASVLPALVRRMDAAGGASAAPADVSTCNDGVVQDEGHTDPMKPTHAADGPLPLLPPQSLSTAAMHRNRNVCPVDRGTSPERPVPIPKAKGNRVGRLSLKSVRSSFETQIATMERLVGASGGGAVPAQHHPPTGPQRKAPPLSYLAVMLRFALGTASTLDLSDGFCREVPFEDFRLGMDLLHRRPTPIIAVDLTGYCSEAQGRVLLQLVRQHRSIVSVCCYNDDGDPQLSRGLVWSLAEACVLNADYCRRLERVMHVRVQREENREQLEEHIRWSSKVIAEEEALRCRIGEERRKGLLKLSATEHIQLVGAHRATKRREQEVEFEAMRESLRDVETCERWLVEQREAAQHLSNVSCDFETLRRCTVASWEVAERLRIASDGTHCWREIRLREAIRRQKHREAIAALSMEEFGARRNAAVLEAHFRAYLVGCKRDLCAEALQFQAARFETEEDIHRHRRLETDRLERERHGFREHIRHEDSRMHLERIRERERFAQRLYQSVGAIEREEAAEFRLIRECRALTLQASKAISAASRAEIRLAEFCRDSCGPALSMEGRTMLYSYAVVSAPSASPPPPSDATPWYPIGPLGGLQFRAIQAPTALDTMHQLVDEVRTLRRKAMTVVEDVDTKLLMEGGSERAAYALASDVRPPLELDADTSPVVAAFLSQRKIVRGATIEFALQSSAGHGGSDDHGGTVSGAPVTKARSWRHPPSKADANALVPPYMDAIACEGFDAPCGDATDTIEGGVVVEINGWRWARVPSSSAAAGLITIRCVDDVVPDDTIEFSEATHKRFCSAVSNILNRLCFRRTLIMEGVDATKATKSITSGLPATATVMVRVCASTDGIPAEGIDPHTGKLRTSTPLAKRSMLTRIEEAVHIDVRPPLFASSVAHGTAVPFVREHGCGAVLGHLRAQPLPPQVPSPKRGSGAATALSSFVQGVMSAPKPPSTHNDSTLVVRILHSHHHERASGADDVAASEVEPLLSLMLRVDPGTLSLDLHNRGTGGATLCGKQVTISPCPMFFALGTSTGEYAFRFPSAAEACQCLEVDLGCDGITTDDIVHFLQRCLAVTVVNGRCLPTGLENAVIRIEVQDASDVSAIFEVLMTASATIVSAEDDGCSQLTLTTTPTTRSSGTGEASSLPLVFVSPDPRRPLTIHPGADSTLVGVPNTLDEHHAVRLMPRIALLPAIASVSEPVDANTFHHYVAGQLARVVGVDACNSSPSSAEVLAAIGDATVTGVVRVQPQAPFAPDDPNEGRFVIFSPKRRPMGFAARRRKVPNEPQSFEVTETGATFAMTVHACTLRELVIELQDVLVSTTHFLLRPKSVVLSVVVDVTITSPAEAPEGVADLTALSAETDASGNALQLPAHGAGSDAEGGSMSTLGAVLSPSPLSPDDTTAAGGDAGLATSDHADRHDTVQSGTDEPTVDAQEALDGTAPPPATAAQPLRRPKCSSMSTCCVIPVEVCEGQLPIAPLRRRLTVAENSGWSPLAPFEFVRPSAAVWCDAFNGGSMRICFTDGQGPEDTLTLRSMQDGPIRTQLVQVKRSNGGPPSAGPPPPTGPAAGAVADTSSIAAAAQPAVPAAAAAPAAAAVLGLPNAALAAAAAATTTAGKSCLLSTPRRKGPTKTSKVDDASVDAMLNPRSSDLASFLSHRRGGRLPREMIDDDVSETVFLNGLHKLLRPDTAPDEAAAAGRSPLVQQMRQPPRRRGNSLIKSSSRTSTPGVACLSPPDVAQPLAPPASGPLCRFPSIWPPSGGDGGDDSLMHLGSPLASQLAQRARWMLRDYIREEMSFGRGEEVLSLRRVATQSNMERVFDVFRVVTTPERGSTQCSMYHSPSLSTTSASVFRSVTIGDDEDPFGRGASGDAGVCTGGGTEPAEVLKRLGRMTLHKASMEIRFVDANPYDAPVSCDDILALLGNVAYVCDPCTALSQHTKLVECTIAPADGPEDRFSQVLTIEKTETHPTMVLLRNKVYFAPNVAEVLCIGCLPITPYAQCFVQANSGILGALGSCFDGGKLIYELVSGAQDGDNLGLMTRDEQLKSKNLYDVWRQEQTHFRNRREPTDARVEEMLHRFTPYDGIGEVSATGKMLRTHVHNRVRGDDVNFPIGMTEAYNPFKVVVELGPWSPEHVQAVHVMTAMNAVNFKTTAGPGDRVVRISLYRGGTNNALQTHVMLKIAVRAPQLYVPDGGNKTFAVKRMLRASLQAGVALFPSLCVDLSSSSGGSRAGPGEAVLRQGYLEMRVVGVETGERLFFRQPPPPHPETPQQQLDGGSTSTTSKRVKAQPQQLQDVIPVGGNASITSMGSGNTIHDIFPSTVAAPFDLYGRRVFVGTQFIGILSVATPTHFKIEFEWSSQCTADHVSLIVRSLHMKSGRGVPAGVSPNRRVEVLLCTGTSSSVTTAAGHRDGFTSLIVCTVGLDAAAPDGDDTA